MGVPGYLDPLCCHGDCAGAGRQGLLAILRTQCLDCRSIFGCCCFSQPPSLGSNCLFFPLHLCSNIPPPHSGQCLPPILQACHPLHICSLLFLYSMVREMLLSNPHSSLSVTFPFLSLDSGALYYAFPQYCFVGSTVGRRRWL